MILPTAQAAEKDFSKLFPVFPNVVWLRIYIQLANIRSRKNLVCSFFPFYILRRDVKNLQCFQNECDSAMHHLLAGFISLISWYSLPDSSEYLFFFFSSPTPFALGNKWRGRQVSLLKSVPLNASWRGSPMGEDLFLWLARKFTVETDWIPLGIKWLCFLIHLKDSYFKSNHHLQEIC